MPEFLPGYGSNIQYDEYGLPIGPGGSIDYNQMARALAQFGNLDPLQNYYRRVAQIESGSNPTAAAPSGAKGLYQFIPRTWSAYGQGSPLDPNQSQKAIQNLTRFNQAYLTRALGRPPSDEELYLAHQQGARGAAQLILNPQAPAGSVTSTRNIRGNAGDPRASAGSFIDHWANNFANARVPAATVVQPAAPAQTAAPASAPILSMPFASDLTSLFGM